MEAFMNIIKKEMDMPSVALQSLIFKGLINAYLYKNLEILDKVTDYIKEAYKYFDVKKEFKSARTWIFEDLIENYDDLESLICMTNVYTKYNLSEYQAKDFKSKAEPLYWYLSLKFKRHEIEKVNLKGVYQKYFVEGKGKHVRKKYK